MPLGVVGVLLGVAVAMRRLVGSWVVVVFLCVFHGGGWLWRLSSAGAAVLRVFIETGTARGLGESVGARVGDRRRMFGASSRRDPRR